MSVFPEGMSVSSDGRFVATINSQASPFPPGSPLYSPINSILL